MKAKTLPGLVDSVALVAIAASSRPKAKIVLLMRFLVAG